MIQHVLDAEAGYLTRLGVKLRAGEGESLKEYLARSRSTILEKVAASARGGLPERGPRGGAYWPARYFVRRDAWHILDHAWELEDRTK